MNKFNIGDLVMVVNNKDQSGTISKIYRLKSGKYQYYLSDTVYDEDYVFFGSELELVRKAQEEEEGGKKYDSGKPDLSLVHRSLVEAAARSLGFGAKKYGRDNYKKGIDENRIYASLLRHIFARMSGEINDPESGLDHLDHIAANVQLLTYYNDNKTGE